ncbi:hypothetical protein B4086_5710 [Bacillus cereus]|nr:hypothetical protein B4086_5710 [Bacillus cereus]
MKLKDYKQLPIDKVFWVNNMQIRWDGENLLTHYVGEQFWYPMQEDEEWYERLKEVDLKNWND